MPSTDVRSEVAVALVYQASAAHGYLSDALRDLGASVVYETETAKFDRPALNRSGAQVIIVNLDPDSDEALEAIDDLLVDGSLKVVFNDGEATSKLSGYDLARWARHLASKIVGDRDDLLPPRPAGAEAVPVRSMPQHGLSSTTKPKSMDAPSVSDESMRKATDAIADALASFDMHVTKLEAKNKPQPSIDDLLGDFGMSAPVPAAAANPFDDLGLSLEMNAAPEPEAPAVAVAQPVPSAALAATVEIENPFGTLDFAAMPADDVAPTADLAETATSNNPFDDLPFSVPASAVMPKAKAKDDPLHVDGLDDLLAFADLNFDELPEDKPKEAVIGLDDFLAQKAPRVQPEKPKSSPPPAERAPGVPGKSVLDGPLSLEAEDAPLPVPAAKSASPASIVPSFSFDLDHLSLEPTEDEHKANTAVQFGDRGMSFESVLDESRPSPKLNAPAAAAPPIVDLGKAAPAAPGSDPFDFSFDEFQLDAAVTPEPVELEEAGGAVTLNDDEDAFMREFAAMTAETDSGAGATPAAGSVLARVWVLGASIGGPDAVREFLAALPADVNAVFVLAQHMGADFVDLMVAQLQKATRMKVAIAGSGMQVATGQVVVVPVAERMLLDPSGEIRVVALDEVSPYSPSIDRALIDIADRFGANAGAIIFSGMAHDAIEGAKHMAAKGGTIWVQDPSTCVVSSMIDGAMDAGVVGFVGTPAELAAEFARRFGRA